MRNSALILPFVAIFAIFAIFHLFSANVGGQLSNFSPYLAMFFCGAVFWKKSKLLLPIAILCAILTPTITILINGTDLSFSNTLQPLIIPLIAYAVIAYAGTLFKDKKPSIILTGSLSSAVFFHIITNLWCFAMSPLYSKSFNGLAQALWTTPDFPGAMPTALFLRNTCLSTLLFTALFLLAARAPFFQSKKASPLVTKTSHI